MTPKLKNLKIRDWSCFKGSSDREELVKKQRDDESWKKSKGISR